MIMLAVVRTSMLKRRSKIYFQNHHNHNGESGRSPSANCFFLPVSLYFGSCSPPPKYGVEVHLQPRGEPLGGGGEGGDPQGPQVRCREEVELV